MFNVDFLRLLRHTELQDVLPLIERGARILDFGAGTGCQSAELARLGFDVVAVDLPSSEYATHRQFEILDYDGRELPLPSRSIDVIISSNVLEHIEDLGSVMQEFSRVLKPEGYCIHIVPSVAWRFWTIVSGIFDAIPTTTKLLAQVARPPRGVTRKEALTSNLKCLAVCLLPLGHGTSVDALSELWSFGARVWERRFVSAGFRVRESFPIKLFHTGHMLFGPGLPIRTRAVVAGYLGGAANVFVIEPTDRHS